MYYFVGLFSVSITFFLRIWTRLALKWYTSIVHKIIFSCILPFFKAIRSDFWSGKPSKLKKKIFLALILSFHNLLQKTLRSLGSDDITKNLPHTSYPYSKQLCESCVGDFLVLFSVFVRQNVTANENVSFTDLHWESGFQIAPNW